MRTAIVGAMALAALMMTTSIGVAETTVLPPSSPPVGGLPTSRDECQDCEDDIEQFSSGTWLAWYEYYENDDGQCDGGYEGCVRCNGMPGCDADGSSDFFQQYEDAELWLASASNCGDCSNGLAESVLAVAETRDVAKLAEFIAASHGSVWLNQERAAIQARGCAAAGKCWAARSD